MPANPKPDKEARLHKIMFNRAKIFRADYDKTWDRNLRWLLGDQKSPDKVWWQSNAVINLMYTQAMSIIPFVGSRKPDLQLDARNSDLTLLSEEVSQLITRAWNDNDIDHLAMQAVFGMLVSGGAWWKITRNNQMDGGMGGIEHKIVPTASMFMQAGVDDGVFFYRQDESEHWRFAYNGVFHSITRKGNTIRAPSATVPEVRAEQWKIRLDTGVTEGPVRLRLGWRPDNLVFVALEKRDGTRELIDRVDG